MIAAKSRLRIWHLALLVLIAAGVATLWRTAPWLAAALFVEMAWLFAFLLLLFSMSKVANLASGWMERGGPIARPLRLVAVLVCLFILTPPTVLALCALLNGLRLILTFQ